MEPTQCRELLEDSVSENSVSRTEYALSTCVLDYTGPPEVKTTVGLGQMIPPHIPTTPACLTQGLLSHVDHPQGYPEYVLHNS